MKSLLVIIKALVAYVFQRAHYAISFSNDYKETTVFHLLPSIDLAIDKMHVTLMVSWLFWTVRIARYKRLTGEDLENLTNRNIILQELPKTKDLSIGLLRKNGFRLIHKDNIFGCTYCYEDLCNNMHIEVRIQEGVYVLSATNIQFHQCTMFQGVIISAKEFQNRLDICGINKRIIV